MATPAPVLYDLDEQTCRRLLRTAPLGRVVLTEGALPAVVPVHFTVTDDHVVVASFPGGLLMATASGRIVAFEADTYDCQTMQGWSVNVVGPCAPVTDPVEIKIWDTIGFSPFTGGVEQRYIKIRIGRLRGRRLRAPQPVTNPGP